MPRAFVGLGSNLSPEINVPAALKELARHFGEVTLSTVYQTRPLHGRAGPDYWNAVVSLWAEESVEAVTSRLRAIEDALGRRRTADRDADRPIDLDLLAYGDAVVRGGEIATRPFVAVPLAELAPELTLAELGPVALIAGRLPRQELRSLPQATAQAREVLDAARASSTNRG